MALNEFTHFSDLWLAKGKTIAQMYRGGDTIGIRFTDNTYIVFKADTDYDSVSEMNILIDAPELDVLHDLGVIDTDEFHTIIHDRKEQADAERTAREKRELVRLLQKYNS